MTLLRMLAFKPADSVPGSVSDAGKSQSATTNGNAESEPQQLLSASPVATSAPAPTAVAPLAKQEIPTATSSTPAPVAHMPVTTAPEQVESASKNTVDSDIPWNRVLEQLELRGAARELARNVQLTGREDETWHFAIPRQLQHLGSGELTSELEQALVAFSGQSASVRLHASDEEIESPAGLEESKLNQKLSEAEQSIHQDSTVQALTKKMGANVVSGSIEPVQ